MLNRVSYACIGKGLPVVLLFVCIQAGLLFGQWGADYRLTTDNDSSFTSEPNAWCIAACDDNVHVVWYDNRDGNWEIYYKHSVDGGTMWSADMRLTWATGPQSMPSVAVCGTYVHVVWADFTLMGNTEVYYCRSTNSGNSWQTPMQISNAAGFSAHPSVAAHDSYVHITWHDARNGYLNNEIYYKRSTDNGVNWSFETRLTEYENFSNVPSVAVTDSIIHVAWEENRDGNFEMYYKSSTDNGQSWGTDIRLTDDAADSHFPSLAASGSNVHLVWQDMRDANEEIYYKVSNDYGASWDPDIRLTDDAGVSQHGSICVSGETVHVVWADDRPGNWELFYKRNPTGNTGIAEYTNDAASTIQLTAMPNPFSRLTTVSFNMEHSAEHIGLCIYDATGRVVKSFDQVSSIENQVSSVVWNGHDDYDRQLANGVYFVKLEADGMSATEKVLLVR